MTLNLIIHISCDSKNFQINPRIHSVTDGVTKRKAFSHWFCSTWWLGDSTHKLTELLTSRNLQADHIQGWRTMWVKVKEAGGWGWPKDGSGRIYKAPSWVAALFLLWPTWCPNWAWGGPGLQNFSFPWISEERTDRPGLLGLINHTVDTRTLLKQAVFFPISERNSLHTIRL